MQESFYLEYVSKYFPSLVLEVVEKLNEKRASNALTYLYKDLLTPTYSMDSRWAGIIANYTRVAADIVSLDSELPLKSRDSIEVASGDIPKIGMKMYLTEKQMKDLDNMIAVGLPIGQIVQVMFEDLPRCIEAVWERLEATFLSELSTGVGVSEQNNGMGVRINCGYLEENQKGVLTPWKGNSAALAIDDIEVIFDKALEDQNTITDVWADDFALRSLYANEQVRQQFAFDMNFVGDKIPTLDFQKLQSVFLSRWGVTLHRVARKIKAESNGKKNNFTPWAEGVMVFTCDERLGSLVWTNCAEVTRPVAGVTYQIADDFILVSRYSTNDPLREFTSSQAMAVPVLNNVDRIYTLNSKKATA